MSMRPGDVIIPAEVYQDRRLGLIETRVLCALYSFYDPRSGKVVFPSRKTISERCGYSVHRISQATTSLEALGWLKKKGRGGYSKSTRYTLSVPENIGETVTELGTVQRCPNRAPPPCPNRAPHPVPEPGTRKEQTNRTDQDTTPYIPPAEESEKSMAANKKQDSKKRKSFQPPGWLNMAAWEEFEQHRKDIKKPLSDLARKKAIKILEGGSSEQQQAIIDMTIQNRWTGLFRNSMRDKNETHQAPYSSRARRVADKLDEIAREDIEKNGFAGSI